MRRQTGVAVLGAALALAAAAGTARADWQPDPGEPAQQRAAQTVARFREAAPQVERFFEQAFAYAVYPRVGRAGFGIGGARGKGLVIEQGSLVGETTLWQLTHGIHFGFEFYSEIVFFQDAETLAAFKEGNLEFRGRAGAALATLGASADPAFNGGVAVFTLTRLGLMVDVSVSGAKYAFRPYQSPPDP